MCINTPCAAGQFSSQLWKQRGSFVWTAYQGDTSVWCTSWPMNSHLPLFASTSGSLQSPRGPQWKFHSLPQHHTEPQQFLRAGHGQDGAWVTCVVSWAAPRHKGPADPAAPRGAALNMVPCAKTSKSIRGYQRGLVGAWSGRSVHREAVGEQPPPCSAPR